MRPHSRASASVFPDAFYIRERGRFFPDDSEDKGRLLSAGYHNVMGYFRDDTPLMELILDDKRKEGTEPALGRVRLHCRLHGAHLGSVLLQSKRRSSGQRARIRDGAAFGQGSQRFAGHLWTAGRLSRQGRGERQSGSDGGDPISLPVGQRHAPVGGANAGGSRAAASRRSCQICGARLPAAAVAVGTQRDAGLLPVASRKERPDARRGDPRLDCQRAHVAEVLLPHRSEQRHARPERLSRHRRQSWARPIHRKPTAHSFAASTKSAGRNERTGARNRCPATLWPAG